MNNDYNNPAMKPNAPVPGKGLAIGAIVCSAVGLFFALTLAVTGVGEIFALILSIVGIVLSICAKKQGYVGGMVTAALILGIVGAALSLIMFIACVACVGALGQAAQNVDPDELQQAIEDAIESANNAA